MWFSRVFSDLEKQYWGERYLAKGLALTQGLAPIFIIIWNIRILFRKLCLNGHIIDRMAQ
jgi:hypothetical protein